VQVSAWLTKDEVSCQCLVDIEVVVWRVPAHHARLESCRRINWRGFVGCIERLRGQQRLLVDRQLAHAVHTRDYRSIWLVFFSFVLIDDAN